MKLTFFNTIDRVITTIDGIMPSRCELPVYLRLASYATSAK